MKLSSRTYAAVMEFILGEPLSPVERSYDARLPKWKALAVFSADALSSTAYATEEMLIPLLAFSAAASFWSGPISLVVAAVIAVVLLACRRSILHFPAGGATYAVAKEQLGTTAGLFAAAALLIDAMLTVAVSVAASSNNLVSAFGILKPYPEAVALGLIAVVMWINLRGLKQISLFFAIPVYGFLFLMSAMILLGWWRLASGEHVAAEPLLREVYPATSLFVLLRSFSSGSIAVTGLGAIPDRVEAFQPPIQRNAEITLRWLGFFLLFLFVGVTSLSIVHGLVPRETHETLISQVGRKVFGKTGLYYLFQISVSVVLLMAANTAYRSFSQLVAALARDRFLPRQMASLGDRMVFTWAIVGMSVVAAFLTLVFKADTHDLIPLYAIGAFLALTLGQTGMVFCELQHRRKNWKKEIVVSGFAAVLTALALLVVVVTKFTQGAWMVILLIPFFVLVFMRVRAHYEAVGRELTLSGVTPPKGGKLPRLKHTVVVPISGIHRGVIEALRYALTVSPDVRAVHVEQDPGATERLTLEWDKWAREIPFIVLRPHDRSVIKPVIQYVLDVESVNRDDLVTVVIPEFITTRWWHQLLHNQTAFLMKAAFMFRPRVVVTTVRYHLGLVKQ